MSEVQYCHEIDEFENAPMKDEVFEFDSVKMNVNEMRKMHGIAECNTFYPLNEEELSIFAKNGIDGVYTADPNVDPNAEFISEMTYKDVIAKELKVMDLTAVSLCMQSGIEIVVFDMKETENFRKVVTGEKVGTKIVKGE